MTDTQTTQTTVRALRVSEWLDLASDLVDVLIDRFGVDGAPTHAFVCDTLAELDRQGFTVVRIEQRDDAPPSGIARTVPLG